MLAAQKSSAARFERLIGAMNNTSTFNLKNLAIRPSEI